MLLGGFVYHRARTPWQLQKTPLIDDHAWRMFRGIDLKATRAAAWQATKVISYFKRTCGRYSPVMLVSAYARGRCKIWKPAHNRARIYRKYVKALTPQPSISKPHSTSPGLRPTIL